MAHAANITVIDIAQSMNIDLNEEILNVCSRDAEMFILNILENAQILIETAKRQFLQVRDIKEILTVLRIPQIYGYSSIKLPDFVNVPYTNNMDLRLFKESTILLDKYANSSIGPYQVQPSFDCSWIVVNGNIVEDRESGSGKKAENTNQQANSVFNEDETPIYTYSQQVNQYFEKSIEWFRAGGMDFEVIVSRMATDGGIGSLLPQYIQFIYDTLSSKQDDCNLNIRLLNLERALIINPSYNSFSQLDDLISIILTILFAQTNEKNILNPQNIQMRVDAVDLIKVIIDKFRDTETQINSQIAEELLKTIFTKNIDGFGFYGAILAFSQLGRQVIRLYLLPNVEKVVSQLMNADYYLIQKNLIYESLLQVVGTALFCDQFLMNQNGHYTYDACTLTHMSSLSQVFGGDLRPYMYESEDAGLLVN